MIINTPISLGELIDKISILVIKEKKIKDEKKNNLIREELTLLRKTLNEAANNNSINNYLNQLIDVNSLRMNLFFFTSVIFFSFMSNIEILSTSSPSDIGVLIIIFRLYYKYLHT